MNVASKSLLLTARILFIQLIIKNLSYEHGIWKYDTNNVRFTRFYKKILYFRISNALKESEPYQQAAASITPNTRNSNQRSAVRMQSKRLYLHIEYYY